MKYMTAKHRFVPGALVLFERMAKDRTSYCLDILGKNIPVLPGVFSAKYPDAMWFAKTIPPMVGNRSFLEIGTGTGMVALFVGQRGSKKIVTTDIILEPFGMLGKHLIFIRCVFLFASEMYLSQSGRRRNLTLFFGTTHFTTQPQNRKACFCVPALIMNTRICVFFSKGHASISIRRVKSFWGPATWLASTR